MYTKVFLALMIIPVFCDSSLSSSGNCDIGVSYWCSSEAAAKECQKEAFCHTILLATRTQVLIEPAKNPTSAPLLPSHGWPYVTPAPGRYTGLYPGTFGK